MLWQCKVTNLSMPARCCVWNSPVKNVSPAPVFSQHFCTISHSYVAESSPTTWRHGFMPISVKSVHPMHSMYIPNSSADWPVIRSRVVCEQLMPGNPHPAGKSPTTLSKFGQLCTWEEFPILCTKFHTYKNTQSWH